MSPRVTNLPRATGTCDSAWAEFGDGAVKLLRLLVLLRSGGGVMRGSPGVVGVETSSESTADGLSRAGHSREASAWAATALRSWNVGLV